MDRASAEEFERIVSEADPDRMAASFFAPATVRPALMALYAFNVELARIRDLIREPMAGHMRLAWWRGQLERIARGEEGETPLLRALSTVVAAHGLPVPLLLGAVDARGAELSECPFSNMAALETYVLATSSALMKLAARICGAGAQADSVAGPCGLAFGLVGILRSLPHDARRRRCFLPLQDLAAHGCGPEDVFAMDGRRVEPVVRTVLDRAEQAILGARRIAIPRPALAAILPTVLARQSMALLRATTSGAFMPIPHLSRVTAVTALLRGAWTRRV
jgi:phytoene synthase